MAALMAAVQAEAEEASDAPERAPQLGPRHFSTSAPIPSSQGPPQSQSGVGWGGASRLLQLSLSQTANTDPGAPHGLNLLPATSTEDVAQVQDLCPNSRTPQDAQGGKNPSPGREPQPALGTSAMNACAAWEEDAH